MMIDCKNIKEDMEITIKYPDSRNDPFLKALTVYVAAAYFNRATGPFSDSNSGSW